MSQLICSALLSQNVVKVLTLKQRTIGVTRFWDSWLSVRYRTFGLLGSDTEHSAFRDHTENFRSHNIYIEHNMGQSTSSYILSKLQRSTMVHEPIASFTKSTLNNLTEVILTFLCLYFLFRYVFLVYFKLCILKFL